MDKAALVEDDKLSAEESSIKSQSNMTQSDSKSYRKKLQDRIQSVKERASSSFQIINQNASRTHQSDLKSRPLFSTVNDILSGEEIEIKKALRNHSKLRHKWRETDEPLKEILSSEEAFDFFAKVFVEHPQEAEIQMEIQSGVSRKDDDAVISGEYEDHVKLLTADYLGLAKQDNDIVIDSYIPPTSENINARIAKEKELYCHVTSDQPSLDAKLGGATPRFIEEEGFYKPLRPPVSQKNLNRLQNRLLTSGNRKWFGEDGEPFRLPDPIRNLPMRPAIKFDFHNHLNVQLQPATPLKVGKQSGPGNLGPEDEDNFILEIELTDLAFTHHWLFSREHVLSNKLNSIFKRYKFSISTGQCRRLHSKLQALRSSKENTERILASEQNSDLADLHRQRLRRYIFEIQETREKYLLEMKTQRDLLTTLLSTWRDLKQLRESQGYALTTPKLVITQHSNDTYNQVNGFDFETNKTIQELREELEMMQNEEGVTDFSNISFRLGCYLKQSPTNLHSKEKAAEIDPQKVHEKLLECLRPPDEPQLTIDMSSIQPTPVNLIKDSMEQERQASVRKCIVWLTICFNNLEVCRTRSQVLSQRFTVSFNERLSLNIAQCPESISVNIHFSERSLTTIYLPIPESGVTLEVAQPECYEFSCDQVVQSDGTKHNGVGAGIAFKSLPDDKSSLCLFISGSLTCRTGWGVVGNSTLAPPLKQLNIVAPLSRRVAQPVVSSMSTLEKMKKWADQACLDPNDPNNVEILELLRNVKATSIEENRGIIFNEIEQDYNMCVDEELITKRLKLLILRDQEELEFKNLRFVPLKEREISKDIFKDYENRTQCGDFPSDISAGNGVDVHRLRMIHQLNKLRAAVSEKISLAAQNRTLLHMVNEDQVPDMGTLGLTFMKWLQPNRPLRPNRKELKKIPAQGLFGQEIKIIVNIIGAFEIPIRQDVDTIIDDKFQLIPVHPFVEVSFQNKSYRTTSAEGSNPTWNQDLVISLKTTNIDLSMLNEVIYIHLFDEVVIDLLEDDRLKGTMIHQRFERHWLGSLSIPFSTLYHNFRIEGTFQLYSPPCLLGYERLVSAHSRNATFLTLFIMLQPVINPPPPVKHQLESYENSEVVKYLDYCQQNQLRSFPKRTIKTLVVNSNCKSVCVTRLLKPLNLPNLLSESEKIPEAMIARYVSMIPTSRTNLFETSLDVWLTGDQVIGLLIGNNYDHAVLLCCYLMKLKKKVWLIIGSGIPHGPSAYVLVRENSRSYYIWDSVSGLKYDIHDSFSPLQSVYCIINDQNIWANIQRQEDITRMRWDVSKSSDWNPIFGRNMSAPLGSIQPAVIDYPVTPDREVLSLQEKVETLLRDAIMKWRSTNKTIWNRYCTAMLRKLLPSLEQASWTGSSNKQMSAADLIQELQHILASHKMCGFPINMPYTNVNDLMEAVKATGVHTNNCEDVEFSLAVYIHVYPAHVLSAWVYVTSLIRRR
nr:PREDICTED: coiled-coil and C2 domain-containing protein 2A [Bemisia tabaci]